MFAATDPKGSFLGSISPWNLTRSTTPQLIGSDKEAPKEVIVEQEALHRSQGDDHAVTRRPRVSLRRYPRDCPPAKTRWFYAVDVPKRKPKLQPLGEGKEIEVPRTLPRKYVPFSSHDSQALENAFQKLAEDEETTGRPTSSEPQESGSRSPTKVPVNEDFLFDVDIEERELSPAYWLGPVYHVKRGSWFFQEGSIQKPCDENLATQLEEGYLKVKPWRNEKVNSSPPAPAKSKTGVQHSEAANTSPHNATVADATDTTGDTDDAALTMASMKNSYRLFGAYMNTTVTYQDGSVAWLNSDNFMSRVSSTVYQRFGTSSGTKVCRGFLDLKDCKESEVNKEIEVERDTRNRVPGLDDRPPLAAADRKKINRRSAPAGSLGSVSLSDGNDDPETNANLKRTPLERHISSLAGDSGEVEALEEAARKQEEMEMEDSGDADHEERDRPIEHLILVTHGIGQRLGLRLESLNFIHDVNLLRKTMKNVYQASADLQALNARLDELPKNCRIQVLPVYVHSKILWCWRHKLSFPDLKQNRKELDLTDADVYLTEDQEYPSLADITVEGVPAVRNLLTDLAMDVLLYQSAYREHISKIVQEECNRLYHLFKQRNPAFDGQVSLCGHSLGSAILFDILCRQPESHGQLGRHVPKLRQGGPTKHDFALDFDCDNFFALGSPIGLFQMLKGRTVAARHTEDAEPAHSPFDSTSENPFLHSPAAFDTGVEHTTSSSLLSPLTISSPKCREFYNIFHPTDPIAYRVEPLISPSMATLKPQPLPYVKRGLWSSSGQGLTHISALVGQGVGSIWSNFTSGVANSLLNRSLGLTTEGQRPSGPPSESSKKASVTAKPISQAQEGSSASEEAKKTLMLQIATSEAEGHAPPTLIDSEMNTLFQGFQQRRKSQTGSNGSSEHFPEWAEAEAKSRKLRREEAKVRALNSNGRVDYNVQESFFDISLIASIASHLSYWADEDVNHFLISQILSKGRRYRRG